MECGKSDSVAAEDRETAMIDYSDARTRMVDGQVRTADVTRYGVIDAMLTVRREAFVPAAMKPVAYADTQIPLNGGRVILDPRAFGKMLDFLAIGPKDLVLDIGCGLGYSTAVIAHIAEAVIGVEEDPAMAAEAADTLSHEGFDNAVVTEGRLAEGDAAHGPYDVIIIEGGIGLLPDALVGQLKEGGRIAAIFVDDAAGQARIGLKSGGRIAWRHAFDATAPILEGFAAEPSFQF